MEELRERALKIKKLKEKVARARKKLEDAEAELYLEQQDYLDFLHERQKAKEGGI